MTVSIRDLAILLALAVVGAGCIGASTDPEPSEPDERGTVTPTGAMAIVDYGLLDLSDPQVVADCARADILVGETAYFWSPSLNRGGVARLKAANPRLKVIGYVSAHGSWLQWGDEPGRDPQAQPYGWDWYQATRPYWSFTTTGDTMMAWPGQVLLNILDPACRAAMVGVLVAHFTRWDNRLDGVFWDHFNQHLWVPDRVAGREGALDLDGDGIPHREDEDEMAAYRAASASLVAELRQALGPDLIQVANGNRAATDSVFAGMFDGMMYENFPEVGFWGEAMRQALDPTVAHNLFAARRWPRTRNGGPWLIYTNKFRAAFTDDKGIAVDYRLAEFSRVAALITGGYATYHPADETTRYGWPEVTVALGAPTGPAVIAGDVITRSFARGEVRLEMTRGTLPFPFDFTITQDGRTVQSLAYPAHFP